jgi:hypothetical protein
MVLANGQRLRIAREAALRSLVARRALAATPESSWCSPMAGACHGRPALFPLCYVEAGSEDWFDRQRSVGSRCVLMYFQFLSKGVRP